MPSASPVNIPPAVLTPLAVLSVEFQLEPIRETVICLKHVFLSPAHYMFTAHQSHRIFVVHKIPMTQSLTPTFTQISYAYKNLNVIDPHRARISIKRILADALDK